MVIRQVLIERDRDGGQGGASLSNAGIAAFTHSDANEDRQQHADKNGRSRTPQPEAPDEATPLLPRKEDTRFGGTTSSHVQSTMLFI
jgi:hypothetical protein